MNLSSLVDSFLKQRGPDGELPDIFVFLDEHPDAAPASRAEVCTIDQGLRWEAGKGIEVERYLAKLPDLDADEEAKLRLIAGEFRCRLARGMNPTIDEFVARFPGIGDHLRQRLNDEFQQTRGVLPATAEIGGALDAHCDVSEILVAGRLLSSIDPVGPQRIGKYRLQSILGDGGFGRVYLAFDEELHRRVAIKVPHLSRISTPRDVDDYLQEARILARLDHNAIVPVYDFGRLEDGRCFAVSKYIEGSDLATKIKSSPLTVMAATELIAIVADALHYSHLRGVFHRDIKPANILVDRDNRPYIADFGIALKEEDIGKDRPTVGTLAYMSPEQLRGEGHLVDGRTDIFSLGIVLYEILSGRKPFSRTHHDRNPSIEARPLRQIDESIPQELDRICQKALAHRVSERYPTARDMAEDLRHFVQHANENGARPVAMPSLSGSDSRRSGDQPSMVDALTIVPKGLRSFDREDAGFFLELLPGPRDRDGLPESVRFWKAQVLEPDGEQTFRVGLLYGPSGSGKSSFLKAGVLPQLPENILKVYVESTPQETEMRLLNALRKQCPTVSRDLDLAETMVALRRGLDLRSGMKVLIVLDQFEQWLHSRQVIEVGELVRALRQCDGERLQCIIAVRDDFWMAITHFLDALEVELNPGHNIAAVDLFSVRHARKVLKAMGRAYGALPPGASVLEPPQQAFVDAAIAELARDGHVIPVHLALFAEMVKDKSWTSSTLKEIGGAAGVGVTFLEETFNGSSASPHHRLHQKAVRNVLASLVSDKSGDIKGGMRSYHDLQIASGIQQPRDFDTLLRILDSELRLITPTDPEGSVTDEPDSHRSGRELYYHLTHDYLVPSIKEWLARKQKETKRGRAQLLLTERAQSWNARPSNRSLPSFAEWIQIVSLVPRRSLFGRPVETAMLRSAHRYYLSRTAAVLVAITAVSWWFYEWSNQMHARSLVESLQSAAPEDVPGIIERLAPIRAWAEPLLQKNLESAPPESRAHLHLSLAYLPDSMGKPDYLFRAMLTSDPVSLRVICDSLIRHSDLPAMAMNLRGILDDPNQPAPDRFRAGVALARMVETTDALPQRWDASADFLARSLVDHIADNPSQFAAWTQALYPVRSILTTPLTGISTDAKQRDAVRETTAAILAEYLAEQPEALIELLLEATPQQYRPLFSKLQLHSEKALVLLKARIQREQLERASESERSMVSRRRARAAVMLFGLGLLEPVVEVLEQPDDPETIAFAEERLSALVLRPDILRQTLTSARSNQLRAALLRALGGMTVSAVAPAVRKECIDAMQSAFRTDPDAAVHSAAEWALRRWNTAPSAEPEKQERANWYVNSQGQTMIAVHGPIEFQAGSSSVASGRDRVDEKAQQVIIPRSYALSATEVTMEQFLRFRNSFAHQQNDRTPDTQCPVNAVTWTDAVRYCQWLCRQENLPDAEWPYPENIPIELNMELPTDFIKRTGYRLPTEGEWEFACRGGSNTGYCFGESTELLHYYAWYIDNSAGHTWPVGTLKPNAFGFFDMHGNVKEWCHDSYRLEMPSDDVGQTKPLVPAFDNVTRGGTCMGTANQLRSANRRGDNPMTYINLTVGFRIAKTINTNSAAASTQAR